jgi:hypothetical protein
MATDMGFRLFGCLEEGPYDTHVVEGLNTPRKRMIATFHGIDLESGANALLAVAAPDLRDALESLLAEVDKKCGGICEGNSSLVAAADSARAILLQLKGLK